MHKLELDFPFKATYIKVGSISNKTKNVWIILHGYGQLAEEFAKSFSDLFSANNCVIFPQGLSKFYLKGVDQNIGANWMTSHDRKIDIRNYIKYLDKLYHLEIEPFTHDIKLNLLGFSQGGHTVTRWIKESKISYDRLVLWGTGLAHDIKKEDIFESFSKGENIIIVGDKDRFISADQLEKVKHRYSRLGLHFRSVDYEGGHEIDREVLKKII